MQSQLTYQSTTMYPIYHKGGIWLKGQDIGKALGFFRPSLTIRRIYSSNTDEFSPSMTDIIPLEIPGGKQSTRIFSLWACYIIGTIAHSPRSKDFRRWILSLHESYKTVPEITLTDTEHTAVNISTRFFLTAINEANRMVEKECSSVVFPGSTIFEDNLSRAALLQISAAMANIEAAKLNIGAAMAIKDSLDTSPDRAEPGL